MKKNIDMTTGSPIKVLLGFGLPMLAGNLFSQVYSLVDSIVVGRFVGDHALAAIGAATPVLLIMTSMLIGLNIGVTVIHSQYFGAKDEDSFRKSFANSIFIALMVCALMIVCAFIIIEPLLKLMQTPAEIYPECLLYLRICFIINLGQTFYFFFGSIFRAIGDSRTPLYCLIIASIINIVLDLLFVIVFHWGVAGVAMATIIAQTISAIIEGIILFKTCPIVHCHKEDLHLDKSIIKNVLKIALPMAIQNSFAGLGSILIQSFINGFGTAVIAGYTAATRLSEVALQTMYSIGNTLSVYMGQNIGAKTYDRLKSGLRAGFKLVVASAILIALIYVFFGKPLASLFAKDNPEVVIGIVWEYLLIVGCTSIFTGISIMHQHSLRGLGDGIAPMIAAIIELAVRVIFVAVMTKLTQGTIFLWIAWPVSYIIGSIISRARYVHVVKKFV